MAAGVPPFRPIAKRFRGRSQRSHGIRMSGGQRISALAPETAGPEGRRDLVLAYAAMNGRSSTWLFHEAVPRMWRPMRSDGVLGRGRAALYVLHEFVVMPDHLHLLLTPAPDLSLESAAQLIKGGFSYRLGKAKRGLVWQESFTNHRIRDDQDYEHHAEYIRMNPVRARLAGTPELYPYSSASCGRAAIHGRVEAS